MIVVLKAGCDLSFTRRYCPQAIEEYEQWGFTFDAHGMNTPAVLEMDIEQITRLIKYFTHREAKYDLSGAGLHYIPNAPYYPGSCLIQVTKFSEGPGTRYWGRDKHEVKYYMRCEEEMRGPQMEKWYITINDEDKELTPEEYAVQSPKSEVGGHIHTSSAFAPPAPPSSPRKPNSHAPSQPIDRRGDTRAPDACRDHGRRRPAPTAKHRVDHVRRHGLLRHRLLWR